MQLADDDVVTLNGVQHMLIQDKLMLSRDESIQVVTAESAQQMETEFRLKVSGEHKLSGCADLAVRVC